MSAAEKAEVMKWLNEKWVTSKHCPICAHNNWIISDHFMTPMVMSGGNVEIGGASYPQFTLVCSNCGFTHHFNAVVAKVIPKESGGSDGTT
jgi:hypothetical protein